ncbi:hypothetical protein ScPMuIL_010833 [Solemya velum]
MSRPTSPEDVTEIQSNFNGWFNGLKTDQKEVDEIRSLFIKIKMNEKEKLEEAIRQANEENDRIKERLQKLHTSVVSSVDANDTEQVKNLYIKLKTAVRNGTYKNRDRELPGILQNCHDFCQKRAIEQKDKLQSIPKFAESVRESKKAWEANEKEDTSVMRREMAHLALPQLTKGFKKKSSGAGEDFAHHCVHVCWLIALQDQDWSLEFDDVKHPKMFEVEHGPREDSSVFPALIITGTDKRVKCLVKGLRFQKRSTNEMGTKSPNTNERTDKNKKSTSLHEVPGTHKGVGTNPSITSV